MWEIHSLTGLCPSCSLGLCVCLDWMLGGVVKMGAIMGGAVGLTIGFIFGSWSILRCVDSVLASLLWSSAVVVYSYWLSGRSAIGVFGRQPGSDRSAVAGPMSSAKAVMMIERNLCELCIQTVHELTPPFLHPPTSLPAIDPLRSPIDISDTNHRNGAGPRGIIASLSQYMLSSAATFSFFLSIGSVRSPPSPPLSPADPHTPY